MKLIVNGVEKEFDKDELTISQLIKILGIKSSAIAVAVGFDVIPKDQFDTYKLKEGDKVEIVHFVGGG
ncbi:sulfur carrier protein ThiS [Sulfurihydrogenibium subterraneum]|uniref:sulfur carrier protein ThiS n=1 Tax=Sulfurihydrogenibium subterraneum TaxID=171121 RepID=UPI0004914556|nr:sulfur carrier protein ThiS [Sulfurihydrogenibium subterraneum]